MIAGFSAPLDLVENTQNGNLYVAEYVQNGNTGEIVLLVRERVRQRRRHAEPALPP